MSTVDDINEVVNWIVLVLLIMSIVGAFLTLLTFVIFKVFRPLHCYYFDCSQDIRTYPIKLILFLSVCIIIGFTSFIISFESWIYDTDGLQPFL